MCSLAGGGVDAAESEVDLFAAVRRDSRSEGLSIRAPARKYDMHRRTVREALSSAWPAPRRKPPPRSSRLDPFKPAIDQMSKTDLDAPHKQRHTVQRIQDRLVDELGMKGISYSLVRDYVARSRPQIRAEEGRGPSQGGRPARTAGRQGPGTPRTRPLPGGPAAQALCLARGERAGPGPRRRKVHPGARRLVGGSPQSALRRHRDTHADRGPAALRAPSATASAVRAPAPRAAAMPATTCSWAMCRCSTVTSLTARRWPGGPPTTGCCDTPGPPLPSQGRTAVTAQCDRGLTEQAADAAIDSACRMLRLPTIRAQFPASPALRPVSR